jgi:hypothetical protein
LFKGRFGVIISRLFGGRFGVFLRLFLAFLFRLVFVGSLRHVTQRAFDIRLQVLFVVDVVDVVDDVGVVVRCRRSVVDVPHFDVGRSGEAHPRLSTFVGVRLSTFVGVRHARPLGDVDALLDLSDCCLVNIKNCKNVCVCERERHRQRDTQRERQTERKRKRERQTERKTDREKKKERKTDREKKKERKTDREKKKERQRDTIVARRGERGRQLVYPLISIF